MCPCFVVICARNFGRMMEKNTHSKFIDIFSPGHFMSMEGHSVSFTADDLKDIATQYDPKIADAPVVIGHPQIDAPAYGWVKGLQYDAARQRLVAELDIIDDSFAEAVKKRRYKKISPSFFSPKAPANPKPGHHYLRHCGFLGAAAPAVSGLTPASFAGDASGAITLEFAEMTEKTSLFARIKALIAEKLGPDQAETILTKEDEAALMEAEAVTQTKSEGVDKVPANPAKEEPQDEETTKQKSEKAKKDDEDEEKKKKHNSSFAAPASAREKELADREAAITARERKAIHDTNVSFCEGLVSQGKLLPPLKAELVAVLDGLDNNGIVSFAEGKDKNAAQAIRDIWAKQPAVVSFGETIPKENVPAPLDQSNYAETGAKAKAYQSEQRQKGVHITTTQAVNHITKGAKQ